MLVFQHFRNSYDDMLSKMELTYAKKTMLHVTAAKVYLFTNQPCFMEF